MEQLWWLVSFQKNSDNTVKIINLDYFLECSISVPWQLSLILRFVEYILNFKLWMSQEMSLCLFKPSFSIVLINTCMFLIAQSAFCYLPEFLHIPFFFQAVLY